MWWGPRLDVEVPFRLRSTLFGLFFMTRSGCPDLALGCTAWCGRCVRWWMDQVGWRAGCILEWGPCGLGVFLVTSIGCFLWAFLWHFWIFSYLVFSPWLVDSNALIRLAICTSTTFLCTSDFFPRMDTPKSTLLCCRLFLLLIVFLFLILVTLYCHEVAQDHFFHLDRMGVSHVCHVFPFCNNKIHEQQQQQPPPPPTHQPTHRHHIRSL